MASAKDIVKRIKDEEIEWVDLRFTDPKGKWQHLSMVSGVMGEDELEDGIMFDGSSIEGWKAINESDMILKPDLDSIYIDPFSATPMMIVNCDIVEPSTGDLYGRDPRSTAKRGEAYAEPLKPCRPFGKPDDAHQCHSNVAKAPKQVDSHGRQVSQGHKHCTLRDCVEEHAEDKKAPPCWP